MSRTTPSKTRLGFRLAPEIKTLIEQAASTLGQTVTEFATSQLLRDAQDVLRRQHTTVLSDRDWKILLSILEEGAEPNAAMEKAAKLYKRQIV